MSMIFKRNRDRTVDLTALAVLVIAMAAIPFVADPLALSLIGQISVGIAAAMGVYIMLRLGLVSFTVPAFMAIGGYSAAIVAGNGITNLLVLLAISFVVPALVALPLGGVVLRLRGVYFIFITFVANEVLQILIFETPALTGGASGLAGFPPVTLFGIDFLSSRMFAFVTALICLVAMIVTFAVTWRFRSEFASIEENETLAESLGAVVWKYRLLGFAISAGVSGLAGFALVNMLSTAHPSLFTSWSVNNYIAYVFVGGRASMLGVVVGGGLLVVMTTVFSGYAHLATGMLGLLLVLVLTLAPGGIVGSALKLSDAVAARLRPRPPKTGPQSQEARE